MTDPALTARSGRVRSAITLGANLIKFFLNFLTSVFLARALGPSEFGNFNFLITSFATISMFLDMGVSTAFYTFASRMRRHPRFYLHYAIWLLMQLLVSLAAVALIIPPDLREFIWLGHGLGPVLLALLASFTMNQLWLAVTQAAESVRETLKAQLYAVTLAATYLVFVAALIRLGSLSVMSLLGLTAVQYAVFALVLWFRTKEALVDATAHAPEVLETWRDFYAYCHPLFVTNLVAFILLFVGNWALQKYGGSTEQGYYAVATKFSAVSTIVTASVMSVLWKEMAEAHARGDLARVAHVYARSARALYLVSTAVTCLLVPVVPEVMLWLYGPDYSGAAACLYIMLWYPPVQALGQITGTYFYSSGRTDALRNITLLLAPANLLLLYFALASHDARLPGLGLGAVGLAAVMLIVAVVSIYFQRRFVERSASLKPDNFMLIVIPLVLLPAGYLSRFVSEWLLGAAVGRTATMTLLIFDGIIYSIIAGLLLARYPRLAGIEQHDIDALKARLSQLWGS